MQKPLLEVCSPNLYASFGTYCVFKHSEEWWNRWHFPSVTTICIFSNMLWRLTVPPIIDRFCSKGDSGGPLMCNIKGKMFLIGILSTGPANCNCEGGASCYTQIGKYSRWIQRNYNNINNPISNPRDKSRSSTIACHFINIMYYLILMLAIDKHLKYIALWSWLRFKRYW